MNNLQNIIDFYTSSPVYTDNPRIQLIFPSPYVNYWDYREHFEKTGYFLWLAPEQQARFADGICVDFSMNETFNKQQIEIILNEDDNTPWNASAIGSLAFFKLYGHPKFRVGNYLQRINFG